MQDKNFIKLTDQDAALLEQGASMLEGLENDERNRGNCSTAEGAGCSAHAVRRLAAALLAHEREIGQCLHQIQEPAAAEQAAWHAGLDEGRAQAGFTVSNAETPQAAPAAVAVPDERAAFEVAILKYTPHAILDYHDGKYATPWVQSHWHFWQARAALAATPAAVPTYIEVRECSDCGHIGINDADGSKAACSKCDWQGDSPVEDKCPDCNTVGTMTAACAKCGARASLLAETTLNADPIAPAAAAPVVLPEPWPTTDDLALAYEDAFNRKPAGQIWANLVVLVEALHARRALLATATGLPAQAQDIADLVTGMSVSVDVSTGDSDAGNRYFGTVTVAQEDPHGKHGLTLLVQDAEPNFTTQVQPDTQDAVTQAVRDYYFALDTRQHGGVAAGAALDAIQKALGLNWVQGAEASARAAIAAAMGE